MGWEWYGVKTVYRMEVTGRPAFTDEDYEADATLVEERVVIFKARSFDEAIRKAEKEAESYAASVAYDNIYGQKVRIRYLQSYLAYELFDAPATGIEVFSDTEIVSKRARDETLIARKFPQDRSENAQWIRVKFIDGRIARTMLESMAGDDRAAKPDGYEPGASARG